MAWSVASTDAVVECRCVEASPPMGSGENAVAMAVEARDTVQNPVNPSVPIGPGVSPPHGMVGRDRRGPPPERREPYLTPLMCE